MLSGLARGDDVSDLMAAAAPSHVPGWFTPDVALLQLAVTALDLASPPGAEPLACQGLRERCLPEVTFRGRVEHRNSQDALHAAACMRGGLQPDLLSDAGWWQTPLWRYAVFAVVINSLVAAERLAGLSRGRLLGGSPLGTPLSSPWDPAVVTGRGTRGPLADRIAPSCVTHS